MGSSDGWWRAGGRLAKCLGVRVLRCSVFMCSGVGSWGFVCLDVEASGVERWAVRQQFETNSVVFVNLRWDSRLRTAVSR